jgi:hypothetical protein
MLSVMSPSAATVMTRTSTCSPQSMRHPGRLVRVGVGPEVGGVGGVLDGVDQVGRVQSGQWGQDRVRVVGVVAVEADHDVQVDDGPALEFGGAAVGELDLGRVDAALRRPPLEEAFDGNGGGRHSSPLWWFRTTWAAWS